MKGSLTLLLFLTLLLPGIALVGCEEGEDGQPTPVEQPASVGELTLQEQVATWPWQPSVGGCGEDPACSPVPEGASWQQKFEAALDCERGSVAHGVGARAGFAWRFCLGSLGYHGEQRLRLTIAVTGPDGATRESVQSFWVPVAGVHTCSVYPVDFPGASSGTPGVYTAQFELEGLNVGHASCTVVER